MHGGRGDAFSALAEEAAGLGPLLEGREGAEAAPRHKRPDGQTSGQPPVQGVARLPGEPGQRPAEGRAPASPGEALGETSVVRPAPPDTKRHRSQLPAALEQNSGLLSQDAVCQLPDGQSERGGAPRPTPRQPNGSHCSAPPGGEGPERGLLQRPTSPGQHPPAKCEQRPRQPPDVPSPPPRTHRAAVAEPSVARGLQPAGDQGRKGAALQAGVVSHFDTALQQRDQTHQAPHDQHGAGGGGRPLNAQLPERGH
mmetsp:Transcript_139454/g.446105  ORF Transcript_139454/g.446105 Transcript_139454/m.446105 type:complete len:254 (+) Transcript_139454:1811-2572(+)